MRIDVVTLFPEMFRGFLDGSLLGAAQKAGLLDIRLKNIRDFATGVHRQVDDRPYGGGPGMLLMPGPVVDCVESLFTENGSSETPDPSSGGATAWSAPAALRGRSQACTHKHRDTTRPNQPPGTLLLPGRMIQEV